MNIHTLHICNLDEVVSIDFYSSLVAKNDCIIFYADSISNEQLKGLKQLKPEINKFYLSAKNKKKELSLTMEKWVKLVNQSQRTITWK